VHSSQQPWFTLCGNTFLDLLDAGKVISAWLLIHQAIKQLLACLFPHSISYLHFNFFVVPTIESTRGTHININNQMSLLFRAKYASKRPTSYFKQPVAQLSEFYAKRVKPPRIKALFAGSADNPFVMKHKRQIKSLLHSRAPHLDWRKYRAAFELFAPRVNKYILENHINWLVPILIDRQL
jgi:hypothetical protein